MSLAQRRKGAKKTSRNAAAFCVFAPLREKSLFYYAFALLILISANVSAKTVYVDLLSSDTHASDGSYDRPFKSWRVALQRVTSGDTIVAKNGDYRKAGAPSRWGGLNLTLTLADELSKEDPHPSVAVRADTTGIYRYDPRNPLTIRAESKHGVIIDHIRFHLAQGIVIDGFDIFPNPYYRDASGKKLNSRRNGIHGDSVYEPEDSFNRVKTNDPPGGYTSAWYERNLWTSYITIRNCKVHYECPPGGCTTSYDPLQDDDRLYLIKFNQSHHITIEDNDLFDGKNYQRKPAIDLPCVDDVIVRRNLIRNCHRGVVSKGGGRRVLIDRNVFVDNSGAAFSGGSTDPNLFIDGHFGDPCSFVRFESYDMTARNNLVVSTRPGERPVEPVSIWAAKNARIENNTFVGIGERGVLLVRPGNEVDSPARGCARSARLTQTENLTLKNNIFILSGVVDETMLYQVTGAGVNISNFDHHDNTFFNNAREVPVGGLADPNLEPGFSNADPKLAGGRGTSYETWMATARSQVKARGVTLDLSKANER
jgi:parallel beta helix pectate lyase-like protein